MIRLRIALLLCSLPVLAADRAASLDALIARYHELGLFNGSVLVAENGTPVLRKGYGEANMEWHIANTPDTRFRIGSMTKQFTAALVLQMVEKGQIDLKAPISKYIPEYPKPQGDRVTVHMLLNHTSGIPGYTELPSFGKVIREPARPGEFIKLFARLQFLFEPGTKFSYNNSGYFLLGMILEKAGGKSYQQLLRDNILDPLGLKETGYDSTAPLLEKRASGYDVTFEGYRNTSYLDMGLPFAAGSMYSSADDLLKWGRALFGDGVLKESSKRLMFTPGLADYGYGLFIHKGAITTIEHGGAINGFNSEIARDLETGRLYILLNNTGGAPLGEMVDGIRAILNGKPAPMPKTPSAAPLYQAWRKDGIGAAMDQLKSMRAGGVYDVRSLQLMRVSQAMLAAGKTEDALRMAEDAAAADPKSSAIYGMIARIHARAGRRVEALAAYGKAIELSESPRGLPGLTAEINELSNLEKSPDR